MYWIKKIIIGIVLTIIVSIAISLNNLSQYEIITAVIFIGIISIMWLLRVIFSRIIISNIKKEIFKEVIKKFRAKINPYGKPEFEYENRIIFIDYNFKGGNGTSPVFAASYIKTPEITSANIELFNPEFKISKIRNEYYVIFSIHWVYEGNTFQEQLSKNLKRLNFFINNNAG